MRNFKYILAATAIMLMMLACKKEEVSTWKQNETYLRFYPQNSNGKEEHRSNANRPIIDTVRFKGTTEDQKKPLHLQTIGFVGNTDRKFEIVQTEPFQVFSMIEEPERELAVSGVDFVPFDDPEYVKTLVFPANESETYCEYIIKYDDSPNKVFSVDTDGNKVINLYFRLIPTSDFKYIGFPYNYFSTGRVAIIYED